METQKPRASCPMKKLHSSLVGCNSENSLKTHQKKSSQLAQPSNKSYIKENKLKSLKIIVKSKIMPSSVKFGSKTISPVYQLDKPKTLKETESDFSNSNLTSLKTSKTSKIRNFSGEIITSCERRIIDKMIEMEKAYENDPTHSKVKQYLNLLDDISDSFPSFKTIFVKLKDFFEKLYFSKVSQESELKDLRQKLNDKVFESFDRELMMMETNKADFIQELIQENKICNEKILNLQKELNTLKTKGKQYQNFILYLKEKGSNFEELYKEYFSRKKTEKLKIPKLNLTDPDCVKESNSEDTRATETKGFHDEFMSKINEFSDSWRQQIENHKKY